MAKRRKQTKPNEANQTVSTNTTFYSTESSDELAESRPPRPRPPPPTHRSRRKPQHSQRYVQPQPGTSQQADDSDDFEDCIQDEDISPMYRRLCELENEMESEDARPLRPFRRSASIMSTQAFVDAIVSRDEPSIEMFDWNIYLALSGAQPAPPEAFRQGYQRLVNRFQIGMKLEVKCKIYDSFKWFVGTVSGRVGLHLKLTLDWSDERDEYFVLIYSCKIKPCTPESQDDIWPPTGYDGTVLAFMDQLERLYNNLKYPDIARTIFVPPSCFPDKPERPNRNLLKPGMKLEAHQGEDPETVRPATVVRVIGEMVDIHYDGLDSSHNRRLRYDSSNIFPVNWCRDTKHPLEVPINWQEVAQERIEYELEPAGQSRNQEPARCVQDPASARYQSLDIDKLFRDLTYLRIMGFIKVLNMAAVEVMARGSDGNLRTVLLPIADFDRDFLRELREDFLARNPGVIIPSADGENLPGPIIAPGLLEPQPSTSGYHLERNRAQNQQVSESADEDNGDGYEVNQEVQSEAQAEADEEQEQKDEEAEDDDEDEDDNDTRKQGARAKLRSNKPSTSHRYYDQDSDSESSEPTVGAEEEFDEEFEEEVDEELIEELIEHRDEINITLSSSSASPPPARIEPRRSPRRQPKASVQVVEEPPDECYNLLTDHERRRFDNYWDAYFTRKRLEKPVGQRFTRPQLANLQRNSKSKRYEILKVLKMDWESQLKSASCLMKQSDGYVIVTIPTIHLVQANRFNHLVEAYYKRGDADLAARQKAYKNDPRLFLGTIFEKEMLFHCKKYKHKLGPDGLPLERAYSSKERKRKNLL